MIIEITWNRHEIDSLLQSLARDFVKWVAPRHKLCASPYISSLHPFYYFPYVFCPPPLSILVVIDSHVCSRRPYPSLSPIVFPDSELGRAALREQSESPLADVIPHISARARVIGPRRPSGYLSARVARLLRRHSRLYLFARFKSSRKFASSSRVPALVILYSPYTYI